MMPGDDAGDSGDSGRFTPPVHVPVTARFAGTPPPTPPPSPGPGAARPERVARRGRLRSIGLRLAWLVCALVLAFGTAGIVGGMAHEPGTSARSELTWAADQRILPGLTTAAADLGALTQDVDSLGDLGTGALLAVNDGNTTALARAVRDGDDVLARIESETLALRAKLATLPGVGPGAEGRLGGAALRRYQTLTGALDATAGLSASWDRLTASSLGALRLRTTLADHDQATAAAAKLGTAAKYAQAIAKLGDSDAAIADARRQRDAMAASVDVAILTEWIDRNADYDKALRALYQVLRTSGSKVTAAVEKAYRAEQAARALLPGDTRALIVIMSDVARGGLNQAVIAIEEAKGRLTDALDAFNAGDATEGAPSAPSESPAAPSASPVAS
jgi:hypothetical protein